MFQVINGKLACSFDARQLVFTCVRKSKFCPQHQLQDYMLTRKHSVWRSKADSKPASNAGPTVKPTQDAQCLSYLGFKTNQVVYKRKTLLDLLSCKTYNQFPKKKAEWPVSCLVKRLVGEDCISGQEDV